MAIDFDRLKDEVLEECYDDEDEIKKALDGIEKLKTMPEERIMEIWKRWCELRNKHLIEIEDGSASSDAYGNIFEIYHKEHPEWDEDHPDYNENAFDDFFEKLDVNKKNKYILQAIEEGLGVGDNEYDEGGFYATEKVAEEYNLFEKIITILCWRGGYI